MTAFTAEACPRKGLMMRRGCVLASMAASSPTALGEKVTKKRLGWDKEATGEMDDEKTSDLLRNR